MIRTLLLSILLIGWFATASATTQLKIVTAKGFVSFDVDDDWPVLSMQTKPPIANVVFQLPNTADEGTSHSTNLILKLYDSSQFARKEYNAPVHQYGDTPVELETWEGWALTRQVAWQGDSSYTILDAKRENVGDVSASIRLAWPNLTGNPKTYNHEMETTLRLFLKSILGHIGPLIPQQGETIRRPSK